MFNEAAFVKFAEKSVLMGWKAERKIIVDIKVFGQRPIIYYILVCTVVPIKFQAKQGKKTPGTMATTQAFFHQAAFKKGITTKKVIRNFLFFFTPCSNSTFS